MAKPRDTAVASAGAGSAVPQQPVQTGQARGDANAQEQQVSPVWRILRTLLWAYFLMSLFNKLFTRPQQTTPPGDTSSPSSTLRDAKGASPSLVQTPESAQLPLSAKSRFEFDQYHCAWSDQQMLDLYVYVSEQERFAQYNSAAALAWKEHDIPFSDWQVYLKRDIAVPVTESLLHNGSVFAHVYLTKHGVSPNPLDRTYALDDVVYKRHMLNAYMPRRRTVKIKRLVGLWGSGSDHNDTSAPDNAPSQHDAPAEIVSYWKGNLTVNLVAQATPISIKQTQPMFYEHIIPRKGPHVEGAAHGYYEPILFMNEFWSLEQHYAMLTPENATVSTLPLHLEYYPITMFKFQVYKAMEQSFKQHSQSGLGTASEMDEIKRMLMETNPWFLALTMSVSVLHSLFEFLAFKNDIQFWKKRDDVHGISVRTIITNLFFQVVIFLYLLDNHQGTSWMILGSNAVGLAIEFWKAGKAVKLTVDTSSGLIPRIRLLNQASYTESKTKEYDDQAFRYLSFVIYPCLVGYTAYALVYQEHKGWYSFVLNTLVGYVYAFGFIMMTPQLFINYKLKSVAHMNGRAMIYKFLTTIVDDLFSFIIKMPTWHRLACFRDDVVFLVYVYQRWIYPVDKTRVNEYGQGGEGDDKPQDVGHKAEEESKKQR